MATVHELPLLAPIPRGHEVLVVTFAFDGTASTLVLDRTALCLYYSEALRGPLHQDPLLAVSDPISVITRFAWTVQSAFEGVCAGAMMSTRQSGGELSELKTLLLLDAERPPYR
jgi:hypothetical protein